MMPFYESDRLVIHREGGKHGVFKLEIFKQMPDGGKTPYGCSTAAKYGFLNKHGVRFGYSAMDTTFIKVALQNNVRAAIEEWPTGQVELRVSDFWDQIKKWEDKENFLLAKAAYQASYKLGNPVKIPDILPTRLPLKPHQQVAVSLGLTLPENSGYGFFMEQRTGKTAVAISLMENLHLMRNIRTVLCIVPPILVYNWENEIMNFSNLPDKRLPHVSRLKTGKEERLLGMFESRGQGINDHYPYSVIVIPYDTVSTSIDLLTAVEWDIIFCDESHWFKDPKTNRSKSLLKLRDVSKYRYLLTGTPIGNHVTDLYTQLEFIEEGASETFSFGQFKEETYHVRKDPSTKVTIATVMKDCPKVKQVLAKRSFIVKRSEVMQDLPQKLYETRTFKMTSEQIKVYNQMAKSLIAEIESDFSKGVVSATCILTKLLRLGQITAGYMVFDTMVAPQGDLAIEEDGGINLDLPTSEIAHFEENNRLDVLMEAVLETEPGHKTIVWNYWNPMIDKIWDRFKQAGLSDKLIVFRGNAEYHNPEYSGPRSKDMMREFNENPKYQYLLANQQSANIGLTLPGHPVGQKNPRTICDTMIYFTYNWSYLQRAQSEDRAYEINSTHTVKVIDIMAEHTIDSEIQKALKSKKELSASVTDLRKVFEGMKGLL